PVLALGGKKAEPPPTPCPGSRENPAAATPAINGAFLIGHSTLRFDAMNLDVGRPATGGEIAVMRDQLDQALQEGAVGLSSGLFYPPAMAATTDEVAEVAKPLGKWD